MASANIVKNVQLLRSEDYGYGFSILGGAGSQFPPIIYDIIDGSPASKSNQLHLGDIIWKINGKEVLSCTTKEVLNHLRLSPNVVELKLKTDIRIQEKLKILRDNAKNPDVLRTAITQEDLVGVSHIVAKKSETQSENTSTNSTPSMSPVSSSSQKRYELPRSDTDSFKSFSDNEEKSDESVPAHRKSSSHRTKCASSPPLSEDESDIESLHSFHYSPKAVDMPSVVRLAKRLYMLEGFKKSDVSRHLSKNNEFSKAVAEEYLHYYNFKEDTLDAALRKFLDRFSLAGETQERERVLVHFSKRYLECNPGTFNSQDAVHTLTCAIMLLNTDLHSQNIGRKMTCSEFIDNLAELNDGENFTPDVLKLLYEAIKKKPLKWAMDDESGDAMALSKGSRGRNDESSFVIGSNPFLTTPMGSGVIYKKGYIMRKCCIEPSGKKTAFGKRSWKMWFCVIQDLVMYLHKDEQGARKGPLPQSGQNAVRLHHALANRAHDYSKKEHVFRLQTADQAEYLLQTSDSKELQAWIDAINFVASSLSAPPMAGAVGSQDNFQRPLLPCSITKLNIVDQLEDHAKRLAQLEKDLENHRDNPPDKSVKSTMMTNYKEKEVYLASEIRRYQTYVNLLRSRFEASGSSVNIIGSTVSALDINDLPVFEVKNSNVETDNGGKDDPPCVIPPPIPERPRPGDSPILEDVSQQNENCKDTQTQTKNKKEKKEDGFKRELEKMIKEKDKRDKKAMKKEDKEQSTLTRKKEKDKIKNKFEENDKLTTIKSEKAKVGEPKVEGAKEEEAKEAEEAKEEDPRMGTMDRLKALFKFSKLNRTLDDQEVKCYAEETAQNRKPLTEAKENGVKDYDVPPPLPPKPLPGSPIRMIIGSRMDI